MSTAVRSDDLKHERWDLLSGAACRELYLASDVEAYNHEPQVLVSKAIDQAKAFLGYEAEIEGYRLGILTKGWWYLAAAVQKLDMPPVELDELKSHLEHPAGHFHHYPYYALKRAARTCFEGKEKYAEENWHNGFEIKDLANHAISHMISWTNGRKLFSTFWKDELEDELGHAMWGFMAMTHVWLFRQDKCRLLLGRNYSITDELKKYHDEHASRREVPEPSVPDDKYWDGILEKEEEVRKRVVKKSLIAAVEEARGGPAPVARMAHA